MRRAGGVFGSLCDREITGDGSGVVLAILNASSSTRIHDIWRALSPEQRQRVRTRVLADPGSYPIIYHHIFHRQRRGVGGGLAGYTVG